VIIITKKYIKKKTKDSQADSMYNYH